MDGLLQRADRRRGQPQSRDGQGAARSQSRHCDNLLWSV